MPPIGSTLTDEQIASVLTYVRREWGQIGTPVDPTTIKAVRELTAGRTRPWTNDELTELAAKGRAANSAARVRGVLIGARGIQAPAARARRGVAARERVGVGPREH